MAEEPFSGLNNEAVKRAQTIRFELGEIEASFKRINKSSTENKDILKSLEKTFGNIEGSINQVAKLQEQAKSSTKGTADALKEQTKQLNIVRNLNAQIDLLYEKSTDKNGKINSSILQQAKNLSEARDKARELAGIFGDIVEDSSKLDKSTIFFSKIAEVVKDIPGLRKFSSPFEAAAKAARQQVLDNAKIEANQKNITELTEAQLKTGRGLTAEKLKELGLSEITGKNTGATAANLLRTYQATSKTSSSMMAGLNAGMKSAGASFSNFFKGGGWIGAVIEILKLVKDAMFAGDARVTSLAKNLSISKDAAADVYSNLTNLKGSLDTVYGTTTNIVEAFNQVSTATGFIGVATKDQIETQIILTKNLGLQVEEANQLQGLFAANNTEASKGVDIVYDQVAAFANENKLLASGAQTLKEIQNTSKLILVNFRGNIPALTNAILEAKKLGLSLDQVNKVAGSLLNFEESISAELEAELLLGKDINLERARLFALNNDIAGVTKEIAAQGITIESFSRMNRIQQEAIAKTLGMQAEELGKALYDAKVIEKLGGRDLELKREAAKKAREIAEATGDAKKIAEAMNEEARIAAIEKGILTGKALEDAEKSVSIQEKFNVMLERAKEIFSDVFTGERLDKFADGLERFIKAIESGRSLTSIFLFGLDSKEEKLERYKKLETKRYEDSYSFQEHQKLYYNKPKNIMSKTALINNENIKVTKSGQMYSEEDIMGFAAMQKGNREMAEQKELINTINKLNQQLEKGITANAYLDSNKVGTAQNMATTKT